MNHPPTRKGTIFFLEGLNAFASSYYFNYLFFYLREHFGFSNSENFLITAVHGLIYVPAAFYGGRFAQRYGCLLSLRLGFGLMSAGLVVGLAGALNAPAQFIAVAVWTVGISMTWPSLEAMATEGESPATLPRRVGLYNVVWAGSAALAYFTGGAILETFGWKTIFWFPLLCQALQVALTFRIEATSRRVGSGHGRVDEHDGAPPLNPRPIAKARTFLQLAWLANPLAYIAINVLLPVIPRVADRLELTPMYAGFLCSIWFFARLAAFIGLWMWPGWHYRFSWLIGCCVMMVVTFGCILLFPHLWVVVVGQVLFGLSIGLIYYSSLFYSMDAGDTKGANGGVHEAAIGAGIFAGPALGFLAPMVLGRTENIGIISVGAVLCLGVSLLPFVWTRGLRPSRRAVITG